MDTAPSSPPPASRFTLRDLSVPTRVVIAVFLLSVGFGYLSALVQLHFNGGTKAGELLPDSQDIVAHYSGIPPQSQLEQLITADEHKTFNGAGTMRPAFTSRSTGWATVIKTRAREKNISLEQAEKDVRKEREVERLAMVDWMHSGAKEDDYAKHPLPAALAKQAADYPVDKFFVTDESGTYANVKRIMDSRCVRCHYAGGSGAMAQIHLDEFEVVQDYVIAPPEGSGAGMSLQKLAQTTHVHLLGFSMLYGLTGLLFTLTGYSGWLRTIFGPWALLAQLADIACWWLGRYHPVFAQCIQITGGLAALGLGIQILGTLFYLFDRKGRIVLLLLITVICVVGGICQQKVIGPYMKQEQRMTGNIASE